MKKNQGQLPDYVIRFSLARRVEHHVNALLFIALVITGLSQRYHEAGWAIWVIQKLGGIDSTRLVHRYAGILFAIVIVQHLAIACYGVIFRGWQPSMVINKNDFVDALTNLKYYFGLVDEPARCDRYDYKQKFEYWGVTLGGILMVATGLILWYPVQLFRLLPFLPGQFIPAAKVAHANEAMLALLVIVVWHIYNAVFSPEVFPLDTSIFTGKISLKRLQHEHPLEYEELFPEVGSEPPVKGDPSGEALPAIGPSGQV